MTSTLNHNMYKQMMLMYITYSLKQDNFSMENLEKTNISDYLLHMHTYGSGASVYNIF